MRFLFKKYQAKRKEIIRVDIDTDTKVKFMTARDFELYKKGKTHNYYGGSFEAGEVKFVLPFDSVWHSVVELGKYHEPMEIKASCTLLPPDRDTLSTIATDAPSSVRNAIENGISDFNEDLSELAEDLGDSVNEAAEKGEDLIDGE